MIHWTDEEVEDWAKCYSETGDALMVMENNLQVSHSTLWWCFRHRLENINHELYNKVIIKLGRFKKGGK